MAWLVRTYGLAGLGAILDVPAADLRGDDGTVVVPDVVAGRIRYLVRVTDHLVGAYDRASIRRWWERPRAGLGDLSPRAALGPDWDPAGQAAGQVLALARSLNA